MGSIDKLLKKKKERNKRPTTGAHDWGVLQANLDGWRAAPVFVLYHESTTSYCYWHRFVS